MKALAASTDQMPSSLSSFTRSSWSPSVSGSWPISQTVKTVSGEWTTGTKADNSIWASQFQRVGIRRPQGGNPGGFRMPLAEPGLRLSLRTGLSLDVHAK
jgi:hypothetical protein